MNTAKIVRVHSLGGPEVLKIEELPLVTPKAGEVRIKVQAIGLNRAEVMFRTGRGHAQTDHRKKFSVKPDSSGTFLHGIQPAIGQDCRHYLSTII